MFDVLMYLFETWIHNEAEMHPDQDKLTPDLTRIGFDREIFITRWCGLGNGG